MKGFLYFLGGLCVFTEISMFLRATNGLETFSFIYITTMVVLALLACLFLFKANSLISPSKNNVARIGHKPIDDLVQTTDKVNVNTVKPIDYLIASDIDREILKQDSLELYNDVLTDDSRTNVDKELILYLLIPYQISMIKYGLNKEFYEQPDYLKMMVGFDDEVSLIKNRSSYISPSLRIISKDDSYYIKAYPDYFYIAFPDVVCWAVHKGRLKVRQIYSFYKESELLIDGYLRAEIVQKVINLYLNNTGLDLECKIINQTEI